MEEIKDFDSFYTLKLQPFFGELKSQSNDALSWSIAGILLLIFMILSFMLTQILIAIFFLIFLIFCIYKYTKKKELFIDNYKETIITEVIKYLNPEMIYSPESYMSPDDYVKSGLFRRIYDYYIGDDHIKGTYKNMKFYCSELETSYDRTTRISRGGNTVTTIFKGLFFAAPIKTYCFGGTYIWPTGEEQIANSIMDEYYRLLDLPEVYYVDTQHTEFETNFSVYSTNPVEAISLVDKELMDRLINFKTQINRDIRISFVGGICYVSISINEELFQPSISKPDNKEIIKDYFFSVLLILSIINQLNLNRYS